VPTTTLTPSELVSANLRALRQTARLSQNQVLQRLQQLGAPMDQGALSRKESAKRQITVDDLYRFAAILAVNPGVLLAPQQPKGEVALTPSTIESNATIRSWIRGRRRLARFSGLESAGYRLRDQVLEQQARALATETSEAKAALQTQAEHVNGAETVLAALEQNPTLPGDWGGD
jgi:transcriptional regulator with XRE-family HTH domain